jgi:DeoR/GlpR family transcriptional regulator of sugar metabolism
MYIEQRRQEILKLLMNKSPMAVNEIIERVGDSPATIRRDLTFLEKNGYIVRSRGYAKYVHPEIVHKIAFSDEVIAIAKKAAELVDSGSTIMLDSGSMTLAMSYQLIGKKNLTVVTNSISIANVLAVTDIATHLTGGFLVGREEALVGPDAEEYVRKVKVPLLFISTTGVRGTQGLSCVTPFQATMKRTFIQSAEKVILLIEPEKFETDALMLFADFSDIDCIITSKPIANKSLKSRLDSLGVQVIIAE